MTFCSIPLIFSSHPTSSTHTPFTFLFMGGGAHGGLTSRLSLLETGSSVQIRRVGRLSLLETSTVLRPRRPPGPIPQGPGRPGGVRPLLPPVALPLTPDSGPFSYDSPSRHPRLLGSGLPSTTNLNLHLRRSFPRSLYVLLLSFIFPFCPSRNPDVLQVHSRFSMYFQVHVTEYGH